MIVKIIGIHYDQVIVIEKTIHHPILISYSFASNILQEILRT